MTMAPPTQTAVPNILARLRGFLISRLSSLHARNIQFRRQQFLLNFFQEREAI
jgi:hypothetical protein